MSFLHCGTCRPCLDGLPASCANFNAMNFSGERPDGSHALNDAATGNAVNDRFFAQSSFATYAIAHERNTVKVRDNAPLELVGPLGCGIQTGAGTVWRAPQVGPGSTFAVTGAGAVGLSAVMAAHVAGAVTIIAVDVVDSRLDLARELGATHVINGKETDAVQEIREITRGGSTTRSTPRGSRRSSDRTSSPSDRGVPPRSSEPHLPKPPSTSRPTSSCRVARRSWASSKDAASPTSWSHSCSNCTYRAASPTTDS